MNHPTGPRLIVVCGLPGSGKTTLARQLESKLRAIRFCPDDWMDILEINLYEGKIRDRIEALQWKLTQDLLKLGHTVIIEWGTWGRSERDALRIGAQTLGAAVELHVLDAPIDVLFERIQKRNQEIPPVRYQDLLFWTETFQPPSPEEKASFDPPLVSDWDE